MMRLRRASLMVGLSLFAASCVLLLQAVLAGCATPKLQPQVEPKPVPESALELTRFNGR
jgi:hypothetical protein